MKRTLNILSPPRLATGNDIKMQNEKNNTTEAKQIVQNGQSILLECPIEGNPRPKITWMESVGAEKNTSHKIIDKSDNLSLVRRLSTNIHWNIFVKPKYAWEFGVLFINIDILEYIFSHFFFHFQKIDRVLKDTTFICYANNTLGSFNYTFKVLVEKAPWSLGSTATQIKLNAGGNFSIKCDVDGLPEPTIKWYKNDNILTFNNHTMSNGKMQNDAKNVYVINAKDDDFGMYVCVAENHLGKTKQSFEVIFHPYWSEWSEWSECSKTCGIGFTERHRTCIQLQSQENQMTCNGDDKEVEECMKEPCGWSKWSSCSRTCGLGQMYRFKGSKIEIVACNRGPCTNTNFDKKKFAPILTYESSVSSRNNEQYYKQKIADRYKMTHVANNVKSMKKSKVQDQHN